MAAAEHSLLPTFTDGQPQAGTCQTCGARVKKHRSKQCRRCYLRQHRTRTKFKRIDFIKEFRHYRARFTPEQRAVYDHILRYRPSPTVTDQAEAVDWVMREPAPGVCCEACVARLPRSQGRRGASG